MKYIAISWLVQESPYRNGSPKLILSNFFFNHIAFTDLSDLGIEVLVSSVELRLQVIRIALSLVEDLDNLEDSVPQIYALLQVLVKLVWSDSKLIVNRTIELCIRFLQVFPQEDWLENKSKWLALFLLESELVDCSCKVLCRDVETIFSEEAIQNCLEDKSHRLS